MPNETQNKENDFKQCSLNAHWCQGLVQGTLVAMFQPFVTTTFDQKCANVVAYKAVKLTTKPMNGLSIAMTSSLVKNNALFGSKHTMQGLTELLTPFQALDQFIANSSAAVIEATVMSPFTYLKNRRYVTKASNFVAVLHAIPKGQHIKTLWSPLLGGAARGTAFWPAYFIISEELKKNVLAANDSDTSTMKVMKSLSSGAVAGLAAASISYPFDNIQKRKMNDIDKSYVKIFKDVIKQEGVKGLYRGFRYAMFRMVPAMAATMGAYDLGRWACEKTFKCDNC